MKHFSLLLLFSFFVTIAQGQNILRGLVAYYPFDDCSATDQSGNGANGAVRGTPGCECGVSGQSLKFNDASEGLIFLGSLNNLFNKKDFSVSFFFKPTAFAGVQTIIHKRASCSLENYFNVQLVAGNNTINVGMVENNSKSANASSQLELGRCWHHVVIVRTGNRTQLYLNGVLARETKAVSRVDILNSSVFGVNNGLCAATEQPFTGFLDELRVYDRALDRNEIALLDLAPDRIEIRDTTVFLGNDVDIRVSSSCANTFSWFPLEGVSDPDVAEPNILPTETRTYQVRFDDNLCTAFDTIRISVIDPDDLDCEQVYLPNAFTPNSDGRNDVYGISNPYAIQDLVSFEIFDRWGGRVFFTDDVFSAWDGSFKGQAVNPGVMLYRVRHLCDGEEKVAVGSLTIIR